MKLGLKQKELLVIWMGVNWTAHHCLVHSCLVGRFLHYHLDAEVEDLIHHLHAVLWQVVIALGADLHCAAIQDPDQEHQFVEGVHIHTVRIVHGVDQDHPIPEVEVEVTHQEADREAAVEAEAVVVIEIL